MTRGLPSTRAVTKVGKVFALASAARTSTKATVACLSASGRAASVGSMAAAPRALRWPMAFWDSVPQYVRGRLDLPYQPVRPKVRKKTHGLRTLCLAGSASCDLCLFCAKPRVRLESPAPDRSPRRSTHG